MGLKDLTLCFKCIEFATRFHFRKQIEFIYKVDYFALYALQFIFSIPFCICQINICMYYTETLFYSNFIARFCAGFFFKISFQSWIDYNEYFVLLMRMKLKIKHQNRYLFSCIMFLKSLKICNLSWRHRKVIPNKTGLRFGLITPFPLLLHPPFFSLS